jgi:chromosome segregation ATPase
MPGDEEKIVLSRADLYLVMESYRNNIALNTTLVEQQKQVMILQNDIIDKQQDLAEVLKEISQNAKELVKKQEEVLKKTEESAKKFESCAEEIACKESDIIKAQQTLDNTLDKARADLINSMSLDRAACAQDHTALKGTIKGIIGTFAAIVLGLIGLIATLFTKFNLLDDFQKSLDVLNKALPEILKKLG